MLKVASVIGGELQGRPVLEGPFLRAHPQDPAHPDPVRGQRQVAVRELQRPLDAQLREVDQEPWESNVTPSAT